MKGRVKPALPGGGAGPPLSCPDESPAQDAQKVYQDWRDDKTRNTANQVIKIFLVKSDQTSLVT